jgi:hypothetical protein
MPHGAALTSAFSGGYGELAACSLVQPSLAIVQVTDLGLMASAQHECKFSDQIDARVAPHLNLARKITLRSTENSRGMYLL